MPVIGFGTWNLPNDERGERAVQTALASGYRLIDTAAIYRNEEMVGRAVRSSGLKRGEIFVTTKLFPSQFLAPLRAFDQSLARLGLDYVDLYLIHWPVGAARQGIWRKLEGLVEAGRAKSIGVSNYSADLTRQLLESAQVQPVVNQIGVTPFKYPRELIKFCREHKIIVQAYSPLAQGRELGNSLIQKLAEKYHKTSTQIMIRWSLQHGLVPLPKASSDAHIKENIAAFDFEIDADGMAVLDGAGQWA